MAKFQNRKPISLSAQYARIKQKYTNVVHSYYRNNTIGVRLHITPTDDSDNYVVDVIYKLSHSPYVLLIAPQLRTHDGKKPHHLYKELNGYPRLCLYYPKYKEWTKYDYIADTIIPWISTWLFAYEYWLITGDWNYAEASERKVED